MITYVCVSPRGKAADGKNNGAGSPSTTWAGSALTDRIENSRLTMITYMCPSPRGKATDSKITELAAPSTIWRASALIPGD